jgi:hypothetical protein
MPTKWIAVAMLLLSSGAFAAEPARRIDVYVTPFYEAARTPDGQPQVAVGKQFNDLLASNRREAILAARHTPAQRYRQQILLEIIRRARR